MEEQKNEVSPVRKDAQVPPEAVLADALLSVTQLLLINEKWATEYRTMKHFYSEKVQSGRVRPVWGGSRPPSVAFGSTPAGTAVMSASLLLT